MEKLARLEENVKFDSALELFSSKNKDGKPLYTTIPGKFTFADFYQAYRQAWEFYKESKYTPGSIPSHLRGMDFNHPVEIVQLPPPEFMELEQHQQEGSTWQGAYYAEPGVSPEKLGIHKQVAVYDEATDSHKLFNRVPTLYKVQPPAGVQVRMLKTTTASNDLFNLEASGGGKQYFSNRTDVIVRADTATKQHDMKSHLRDIQKPDTSVTTKGMGLP